MVLDELKPGEIKVVAKTKLLLNRGRLAVVPGQVVVLGDSDREQGVHIDLLLKSGAVVPYESEEQALKIAAEGGEQSRQREVVRNIASKRKRRG